MKSSITVHSKYDKIKNNLKSRGWSKITCNSLQQFDTFFNDFLNSIQEKEEVKVAFQELGISNIEELREKAKYLDNNIVNHIRKTYLANFSQSVIGLFSDFIKAIFGNQILVQKYPQIQLHIPNNNTTKTYPHLEVMAGHSPFTYNFWVPFHQINDESGNYMIDDHQSVKLCDDELNSDIESREDFLKIQNLTFPKVKFGEALFFNGFVYHGSVQHNNSKARVSLDVRMQQASAPLFQKYNDFFVKTIL